MDLILGFSSNLDWLTNDQLLFGIGLFFVIVSVLVGIHDSDDKDNEK